MVASILLVPQSNIERPAQEFYNFRWRQFELVPNMT